MSQVLATGVGITEGPVWHDGRLWFTRLDGGGAVLRLGPEGAVETVAVTGGGANGLAIAGDGTLYVANDGGRDHSIPSAIQRVAGVASGGPHPAGGDAVAPLADAVDGQPFRHCNDLCLGPDGWIWFTDSGEPYSVSKALFEAGRPPERPGLVCRLDPSSGAVEVLDASLHMPNGLAFSPGEEMLYVADTVAHRIAVLPYRPHASPPLGPVERWIAVDGNPDGFCLDVDGRLYVATATGGEVHVLAPDGALERRLTWADQALPLNCCFGGEDGTTLYVTDAGGMANVSRDPAADHDLERIVALPLDVPGLPLHR